ncbi:hypothetical protein [Aquimarina hainanensis]|uniref:hypothetical protein n=1 Tax=Aquimarina hainanensis TaxID=1578017 RepID=UPI00361C4053
MFLKEYISVPFRFYSLYQVVIVTPLLNTVSVLINSNHNGYNTYESTLFPYSISQALEFSSKRIENTGI